MRAISAGKCITEGKLELQRLFEFVENNATEFKAYEMESILYFGLFVLSKNAFICSGVKISMLSCSHSPLHYSRPPRSARRYRYSRKPAR